MKLSKKIVYFILGYIVCSLIAVTGIILVSKNRGILVARNYYSDYLFLKRCKVMEIGNNWDIEINDLKWAPERTIVDEQGNAIPDPHYRIHINHFDPEFVQDVRNHIEIKNDTIRLTDIKHKLKNCRIYIDPSSFKTIQVKGNSNLNLNNRTLLDGLSLRTFDDASVKLHLPSLKNLNIYGRNRSEVSMLAITDDRVSSSAIKKMELYDNSKAEIISKKDIQFKYKIRDQSTLVYRERFATSNNKVISLKKDLSRDRLQVD